MTEAQWRAFHDALLEHNALANAVDVKTAGALRFLDQVDDDGELKWP